MVFYVFSIVTSFVLTREGLPDCGRVRVVQVVLLLDFLRSATEEAGRPGMAGPGGMFFRIHILTVHSFQYVLPHTLQPVRLGLQAVTGNRQREVRPRGG